MIERPRSTFSMRQRLVVLTFATVEEADEWDAAGQPLSLHLSEPESYTVVPG